MTTRIHVTFLVQSSSILAKIVRFNHVEKSFTVILIIRFTQKYIISLKKYYNKWYKILTQCTYWDKIANVLKSKFVIDLHVITYSNSTTAKNPYLCNFFFAIGDVYLKYNLTLTNLLVEIL